MALDISTAPGRYPVALSPRWAAVFLEPLPGVLALGLFLDGAPVEVIDSDDDARAHLAGLLPALGRLALDHVEATPQHQP